MAAPTDQQILDAFKSALIAVASGQSYTINGRSMTRANLPEIRAVIAEYSTKLALADTSVDETGTGILLARFSS
jgi:hypothetical protein